MKHRVFRIIVLLILFGLLIVGVFIYQNHMDPGSQKTFFGKPDQVVNDVDSYILPVPFTPQAPTANWDAQHKEACEEASIIMAAAYLSGDTRKTLPAPEVEEQITKLINWQQKNFGYSLDSNAVENAQMIRSVYGLKAEVVTDYTEEDIKEAIRSNKVVIIHVSGREIGNPYYRPPGPLYHVLVVRGYDKDHLITNDPGTVHGESYQYKFSTIMNARADWDHATNTIDETRSVMVVVSK